MKSWRSIRFRLALWYLAALTLGMTAFGAGSWVVLRQVLLENHHRELEQRLSALQVFLAQESLGSELRDLREESREYGTSLPEGHGVRVATASGELLYEHYPAGGNLLLKSRSIVVRGHPLQITLVTSLADFDDLLNTLAWVMCAVFPIVALIAMSGGWWLAKRAMQPVAAMTEEARQITAQNLSARVSVPATADELQDLAEAWNALLARIEGAVRAVKRFTADAAHELRTPVTVIRTSAELALRHPRDPESYRHTLSSIERETVQMTDLVDQLLLLAKGDAGEWKFRFDTVFADQIVRDLRNPVASLAETQQVRVDWQIPSTSIMIRADETAIRRLLLILIDNALKHTPVCGSISIRLLPKQSTCDIEVSDSGPGIALIDLPHVFDRFYRADPARTGGAGAGLGLAIAKAIVTAHGGVLEVAATSSTGSTFRAVLPLQRTEGPDETADFPMHSEEVER